ncbi:MAG: hypothetical protein K6C33_04345 [Desulfovibrio sp.]|nr:hypothetical protein [Desulfovibrio sp.]
MRLGSGSSATASATSRQPASAWRWRNAVFPFGGPLFLCRELDSAKDCVAVPAGTRMKLFGGINSGDRFSVLHWEALDASRIRQLGWMWLDDLEARSDYEGEQAVRRWIARQRQ